MSYTTVATTSIAVFSALALAGCKDDKNKLEAVEDEGEAAHVAFQRIKQGDDWHEVEKLYHKAITTRPAKSNNSKTGDLEVIYDEHGKPKKFYADKLSSINKYLIDIDFEECDVSDCNDDYSNRPRTFDVGAVETMGLRVALLDKIEFYVDYPQGEKNPTLQLRAVQTGSAHSESAKLHNQWVSLKALHYKIEALGFGNFSEELVFLYDTVQATDKGGIDREIKKIIREEAAKRGADRVYFDVFRNDTTPFYANPENSKPVESIPALHLKKFESSAEGEQREKEQATHKAQMKEQFQQWMATYYFPAFGRQNLNGYKEHFAMEMARGNLRFQMLYEHMKRKGAAAILTMRKNAREYHRYTISKMDLKRLGMKMYCKLEHENTRHLQTPADYKRIPRKDRKFLVGEEEMNEFYLSIGETDSHGKKFVFANHIDADDAFWEYGVDGDVLDAVTPTRDSIKKPSRGKRNLAHDEA